MACWILAKNLAFKDPPSLKFHNRSDIDVYMIGSFLILNEIKQSDWNENDK